MGLLDDFGTFIKTPEGQGLLGAAFGGMAGAGHGGTWNTVGRAGLTGLAGYQDAQAMQQRTALSDMQIAEAKRKMAIQQGMDQAAKASMMSPEQVSLMGGGGPTVANAEKISTSAPQFDTKGFVSRMYAVDPMTAMQLQQSMAKETPFGKVDPKDFTQESIAKFAQSHNYGDLVPARKMEVGPGGQVYNPYAIAAGQVIADPNKPFAIGQNGALMPNSHFQEYEITKARAGKPQISVDARNINTQESEQSKTYGKTLGEIRSGITSDAFAAPGTMAKLDRMSDLLKGVESGTDTGLKAAQLANSFGLKIDPNLSGKEAAASLTRELASALRKPGTGAMTDADFENFMQQVPNLSQSSEGRAKIIATMKAKTARDIEIGKLSREYAKKNNGVIDDGFMDVVSDYVAKNPVVQRTSTSSRTDRFPGMSEIEAELARRKAGGR